MRIAYLVVCLACFVLGCTQSPEVSESSAKPQDTLTPEASGIARAKADIAEGTMQIHYYGKPWSQGKPLVDEQSGLPVKILAGCCVTPEFVEETNAYNDTMRNKAKEKKANN